MISEDVVSLTNSMKHDLVELHKNPGCVTSRKPANDPTMLALKKRGLVVLEIHTRRRDDRTFWRLTNRGEEIAKEKRYNVYSLR